jgi:hypothetical protein
LEIRRVRLRERDVPDIDAAMAHSTERDAAQRLPALADLVVSGEGDPYEAARLVVQGLHLAP